jgi:hypothetical protein
MKLSLFEQKSNFPNLLKYFEQTAEDNCLLSSLKEQISTLTFGLPQSVNSLNEFSHEYIFKYKIFPINILNHYSSWEANNREMKVGDTVVQEIYLPPIQKTSLKLIMGTRIKEVFQTNNKIGFSYQTLKGHVERGVSEFYVQLEGQKIVFTIRTFSEPGNIISSALGPFFSTPYQAYCTHKALKQMKQQFIDENKAMLFAV